MLQYKQFSSGCTFFDVVLQCYLSLNLMPKFIIDNNIVDLNLVTYAGQTFLYDTNYVVDEFLNNEVIRNNYKFVTGNLNIPNSNTTNENYLLIESGAILQSEAGKLFII